MHAARWHKGMPEDLGVHFGRSSGGRAISTLGSVAGWVNIDPSSDGQLGQRAAIWRVNEPVTFLERVGMVLGNEISEPWTHAVDITDQDDVLVAGHTGGYGVVALLWSPISKELSIVGGSRGVYPMGINTSGRVLGKAQDSAGKPVACTALRGADWVMLFADSGYYATALNDLGDIVGAIIRDGFERPWLKRSCGELIWLPYYEYHWCRPLSVNNHGVIVGIAQSDHGCHALVWKPVNNGII
jgi:hypothetical protein